MGWALLGGRGSRSRGLAHAALTIGVWGLVLVPWISATYRMTGHLLPTTTAVRGVPTLGTQAEEVGVGRAMARSAAEDPGGFIRRTAREFGRFWELAPTRLATDDPRRRARLAERFPQVSSEPLVRPGLRDLLSAMSFGLELALAIAGLWLALRRRRREAVWLVAVVLSFALGYALFYGKVRYRIPILPIVFAFAGLGAATVLQRLQRRAPV
jgi:hypothetical protein